MTKTFPKSRICVIDVYPSVEKGIKLALDFIKKHNISLNSGDGKRLLLSYCLKSIQSAYKTTQSSYPKVLCISNKSISKRIGNFIDNYFTEMMSYVPVPYCGKMDLNSPDLESAAESSLRKHKPQRKLNELALKLKLRNID